MNGPALETVRAANGRVTLWLARIAAVALALIALVTFGDVIGRYFFHAPFPFTVEFTAIAMAVIVFFGIGLVTHQEGHICVDIVTLRLSPRRRAVTALATHLLALGFVGLMSWQLWRHAAFLFEKGDTTQVWTVPLWPVAVAVAFGSLFLLTGIALQLVAAAGRLRDPERAPATPPPAAPYRE